MALTRMPPSPRRPPDPAQVSQECRAPAKVAWTISRLFFTWHLFPPSLPLVRFLAPSFLQLAFACPIPDLQLDQLFAPVSHGLTRATLAGDWSPHRPREIARRVRSHPHAGRRPRRFECCRSARKLTQFHRSRKDRFSDAHVLLSSRKRKWCFAFCSCYARWTGPHSIRKICLMGRGAANLCASCGPLSKRTRAWVRLGFRWCLAGWNRGVAEGSSWTSFFLPLQQDENFELIKPWLKFVLILLLMADYSKIIKFIKLIDYS